MVCFVYAVHQFEILAEFCMQALRAVSGDLEATASLRPIKCEGGDDYMPAFPHSMLQCPNIALSVLRLRQEVENGAVMPEIVALMFQIRLRNVGFDPVYVRAAAAEPLARVSKSACRHIQDRKMLKAQRDQIIHQGRCPTSDINYVCRPLNASHSNELQRQLRMLLIPTALGWRF